ncbi:MAG: hypothetical protein A2868_03440 [Candidatus Levybacteria bacterium RIFCSPHIGHO2_01_FULL_40_15b]|nr:MAG: hypothetical protein A2868_03440 [Candidatus Levybacteria bacterium RIFCSPHIGHO2_01_FULL_40_15b]
MAFNIFLAIVPVVFGFLMLRNRYLTIKIIAFIIWITFLPNTLYLITDIIHFLEDAVILSGTYLAIDLFMYLFLVVLGIFTFTLSIYPFERLVFPNKKNLKRNIPTFFILNSIIGFGMVLGRVQRANSWEVFTDTGKVIALSLNTLSSFELMLLALFFGIFCQMIYSVFAKTVFILFRL